MSTPSFDASNDVSKITFVLPHVIERLRSGHFVAVRQENADAGDRRDRTSPLAVTRRAIPCQPLVFETHRELLCQTAEALNVPDKNRVLLLSGPSGRGKTAFARALVELMGGGQAQVLWFDVSPESDANEVLRFLIEYMIDICKIYKSEGDTSHSDVDDMDPMGAFSALMGRVNHLAIGIVIDNIQHLLTPNHQFRSAEVPDALGFLLSFPNVKLMLAGTSVPDMDIRNNPDGLLSIAVPALNMAQSKTVLQHTVGEERRPVLQQMPDALLAACAGEPFLLQSLARLYVHHPDNDDWAKSFRKPPGQALLTELKRHLKPELLLILQLLSLLRHGINPSGFEVLLRQCFPTKVLEAFEKQAGALPDFHLNSLRLREAKLDNPLLRMAMQKVYPPQLVLEQIRSVNKAQGTQPMFEALYQMCPIFQHALMTMMDARLKAALHQSISDMYNQEKTKHMSQRLNHSKTQFLTLEANYHDTLARKRPPAVAPSMTEVEPQMRGSTLYRPIGPTIAAPVRAAHPQPADNWDNTEWIAAQWQEHLWTDEEPPAQHGQAAKHAHGQHAKDGADDGLALSPEELEALSQAVPLHQLPLPDVPETDDKEAESASTKELTGTPAHSADENTTAPISESIPGNMALMDNYSMDKNQAQAPSATEPSSLATFYLQQGQDLAARFQHNKAIDSLHLALANLSEPDADPELQSQVLDALANIYAYRQQYGEAVKALKNSLRISGITARRLFKLALIYDEAQKPQKAIAIYEKCFELSVAENDAAQQAAILYNMGALYADTDKQVEAVHCLKQAIQADATAANSEGEAQTRLMLAALLYRYGRPSEAVLVLKESLADDTAFKALDPATQANMLVRLGRYSHEMGMVHKASLYIEQAQLLADKLSEASRRQMEVIASAIAQEMAP